jgi:flagellar motor protein MotB
MAHEEKHGADAHAEGEGGHKKHKKHHPHRHEEHEHEEGWIVSFADNVLLMMGFFVIMLAMNMGPKGASAEGTDAATDRVLDVAIAVREAFHNPVKLDSTNPNDQPLIRRLRQRDSRGDLVSPGPDGQTQQTQTVRPTDHTGRDGYVNFEQGSDVLAERAKRTIAQLAERIAGTRWMVEVRGHASKREGVLAGSEPDSGAAPSASQAARDLAYARSMAVAQELVRKGVRWDQLRIVSAGDSAPVVSRAQTGADSRPNQRVEILILKEAMPADPYSKEIGR